MQIYGIAAVGIGAALGAWLRWGLSSIFNPVVPTLPLGTLFANLIGGYCVGLVLGYFSYFGELSPELRLFIVTGLLGGLTTFSTFSLDSVLLLHRGEYAQAGFYVIGSVVLSILALLAGLWLVRPIYA